MAVPTSLKRKIHPKLTRLPTCQASSSLWWMVVPLKSTHSHFSHLKLLWWWYQQLPDLANLQIQTHYFHNCLVDLHLQWWRLSSKQTFLLLQTPLKSSNPHQTATPQHRPLYTLLPPKMKAITKTTWLSSKELFTPSFLGYPLAVALLQYLILRAYNNCSSNPKPQPSGLSHNKLQISIWLLTPKRCFQRIPKKSSNPQLCVSLDSCPL